MHGPILRAECLPTSVLKAAVTMESTISGMLTMLRDRKKVMRFIDLKAIGYITCINGVQEVTVHFLVIHQKMPKMTLFNKVPLNTQNR